MLSFWDLDEIERRVTRFVDAARNDGDTEWEIEVFIDSSSSTKETEDKWSERRGKDVADGVLKIPTGVNILLGDIFSSLGVKIHYSLVDNDDTIAQFA